jgi:hypothetical protein
MSRIDVEKSEDDREKRQRLTEVGVGISLLGILANMGLTIGLSLQVPIALRLPIAFFAPVLFFIGLIVLSRQLSLLKRMPWWLTDKGPDPFDRFERDDDHP